MKELILVDNNGKLEAIANIKSEKAMLQIEGATTIDLYISVDGNTFVEHTTGIEITDTDILNLVNCKFMMWLKVVSSNNVGIKLLD